MDLHFLEEVVAKSGAWNFLILSFVLMIVEKLLDYEFVCPCEPLRNKVVCFFYAVVPGFACFTFAMHYLRAGSKRDKAKSTAAQTRKTKMYWDMFYSFLASLIWMTLFLFDGRYVACARSDWQGMYVESDNLAVPKWCKPTGNKTSELESQSRTQAVMFWSEIFGFVLLLILVALAVGPLVCERRRARHEEQAGPSDNPAAESSPPRQNLTQSWP